VEYIDCKEKRCIWIDEKYHSGMRPVAQGKVMWCSLMVRGSALKHPELDGKPPREAEENSLDGCFYGCKAG
jgi:hypothetical protein